MHIATHGEFPEQNPLDFHRVLLAPSAMNDGSVTAEKLREMDFKSTQLVVLSICNGGIYRLGPGDEPYGLTSGLLCSGTRELVGTLWPIEDEKGRRFMLEFYECLLKCGSAEALLRTACKLIADHMPIRDWAGFVVVGPGRPFCYSSRN